MLILIPHDIETLDEVRPWANWLIVGVTTAISLAAIFGGLPVDVFGSMILGGGSAFGTIGHVFLHLDLWHLGGNMIFLWVFGNAICRNTSNGIYLLIYFLGAVFSAAMHMFADGDPAIGASGAINAVVGMVLAMYPLNRVHVFWLFVIKWGTFACQAWLIICVWLLFDLYGIVTRGQGVAYWAHIGGLFGGVLTGLVFLKRGWVQLTEYDNRSLLDILQGQDREP
jgi:membrane associated rhomboid family serine protease